ncbi:MAG: tetratricopeptide repeat protein [Gammaproteobacteria bacterium]
MTGPFDSYDGSSFRTRFFDGVRLLRNSDYEGALVVFREVAAAADPQDVYRNTYRSYEGLARVYLGEKSAVALCRDAAADDMRAVEVHYNLALAEFKLNNRRRALLALQRGLAIDSVNPELRRLRVIMGNRRHPVLRFLNRNHPLNKWLGRLTYRRSRKPGRS